MTRLAIVTPPEFFYLPPELSGSDSARAATLRVLGHATRAWSGSVDLVTCGGRPGTTATALPREPDVIAVVGGPFDQAACQTLAEVLRTRDQAPVVIATPTAAAVPALLHELTREWRLPAVGTEAAPAAPTPFTAAGSLPWAQTGEPVDGHATWIDRYRLASARDRDDLRQLAWREMPQLGAWVETVLEWAALGIDPLEEMYAGNSLLDRNAELLVNIL